MHIIIVGAGRIGSSLARWLVSAGHEIAVVDRDRSRCAALDEALGSVTVSGDGTDAGVLSKAGLNRADVLIATTRKDDVNLVACQLAKHHFKVPRTVSVVNVRVHAELFSILGIDLAIDVPEIVLGRIQEALSHPGIVHLMPVSGIDGKSVVSFKIPARFGTEGRPMRDISLPDGAMIPLVITREGEATIPSENTLIRAGDEVVAVTTAQFEEDLRDLFTEENEK
jgi:trk system potassium uptake protein TrkA